MRNATAWPSPLTKSSKAETKPNAIGEKLLGADDIDSDRPSRADRKGNLGDQSGANSKLFDVNIAEFERIAVVLQFDRAGRW